MKTLTTLAILIVLVTQVSVSHAVPLDVVTAGVPAIIDSGISNGCFGRLEIFGRRGFADDRFMHWECRRQ